MPVEFYPKAPVEYFPFRFVLVPAVATWRHDRGEVGEVEVEDGLKRLRDGAFAQAIGQAVCQATYSVCKASRFATVSDQC